MVRIGGAIEREIDGVGGCRIAAAGVYLEYRSIGGGGRVLLDVGFELVVGSWRDGGDREEVRTGWRGYLQRMHPDLAGSRLDCP